MSLIRSTWNIFGEPWVDLENTQTIILNAYEDIVRWQDIDAFPEINDFFQDEEIDDSIYDTFLSIIAFGDPKAYQNISSDEDYDKFSDVIENKSYLIDLDIALVLDRHYMFYMDGYHQYKNIPFTRVW